MEALEIDDSVLPDASNGISRRQFIPPQHFKKKKGYLKTRFHERFMDSLADFKDSGETFRKVCGITGIGKTFTLIYFMLDCLKKRDDSVHYIDLCKPGFKVEKFCEYAKSIREGDLLILDHVTLSNGHSVDEIVKDICVSVLKVEADSAAIASRKSQFYGKEYQLHEEEFNNIWLAFLKTDQRNLDLGKEGREIYEACRGQYLMTLKLIRRFCVYMCSDRLNIAQALLAYRSDLEEEINSFVEYETTDAKFQRLQLHTRILLHYIQKQGDFIFTSEQFDHLMIAINVFHIERLEVTMEDLEKDHRFLEAGLKERDRYYRMTLLAPSLAVLWRQKLCYEFPGILETASVDHLVDFLFHTSGAQKETENLLISVQKEGHFAVTSGTQALKSTYEKSDEDSFITQVKQIHTYLDGRLYTLYTEDLRSIETEFTGPAQHVAKCALWIKEKVKNNPTEEFILQPALPDLMGINYFHKTGVDYFCQTAKKLKCDDVLYLVKVASGAYHSGETVGMALEVVQEILAEENLTVHVIIIIAVENLSRPFCLKRCKIENASAINLSHPLFMERIKISHKVLYDFVRKVISKTPDADADSN